PRERSSTCASSHPASSGSIRIRAASSSRRTVGGHGSGSVIGVNRSGCAWGTGRAQSEGGRSRLQRFRTRVGGRKRIRNSAGPAHCGARSDALPCPADRTFAIRRLQCVKEICCTAKRLASGFSAFQAIKLVIYDRLCLSFESNYSISHINSRCLSLLPSTATGRNSPTRQPANPTEVPMSLINTEIKPFKASAYQNGEFIEVTDASLKGKWSVLIFMPAAFTFNCPTEVEDAANNYAEFQKAGAEVYIVTTDTHFSHKVWHETSPAVGKAQFPLGGDPTHQLTRAFGVHIEEEGLALRGTFIINPEGVIKTLEIHDNAIARDVSETLRKLKAAQFVAANPNEVCPAKWKEGEKTIAPSLDLVGKI